MFHMVRGIQNLFAKIGTEYKGLLKNTELYKYILETSVYPREAEPLKEIRKVTSSHPEGRMMTAPDSGQLLGLLLRLVDAKKTLEIGVFTGYSLLLTALCLPENGKVTGVDMDRQAYEIGLPIIKKAGVEHKIDFIESLALPCLDKLLGDPENIGSFDFVYADADKANYWEYHERLLKLVRVGGLIVYDNTLWGGTVIYQDEAWVPENMRSVWRLTRAFNEYLATDSRVEICQVPSGDGVTICMRVT